MPKVSFLIALLVIVRLSVAQDSSEFERLQFQTETDTLLYRLLRPIETTEGLRYPLVIFLHGSGERGNDNMITLKYISPLFLEEKNRADFPCYLMVPQCPESKEWTYTDWYKEPQEPMSTLLELIDSLSILPSIDPTRVYVTGLSMGGYGTWYLITRFPEKFAAAVPICGGGDWTQVSNFSHMPIWAFHGAKDDVVDPNQSRRMIKALKLIGGNPKYTEYKKTGHDSWTKAFEEPELLPWLFSQQKVK